MNLLTDPLFRVETKQGKECVSLPALFARLGKNEIDHLVGIQRHQYDAFHVFLCYLAGAVLVRTGNKEPVQNEDFWREGLLALAGSADYAAWQLIADNDSQPAFMQPALPGNKRKPTSIMETPDHLDLLLTAKNHDVKEARAGAAAADSWIYALVSLQTMSGFYGRGNYGIARMNSGYGNRAIVELMRDRSPGQRWLDAVDRLLIHREQVLQEPFGFDPQGLVLTWLQAWDGSSSLTLAELDPFYIEICRLIRLRGTNRIEWAEFYPSTNPRIAAKELNGVVGDPWLPVDLKATTGKGNLKALTFPPVGITAEHMRRLLFEDEVQLSVLQKPKGSWSGDYWLSASVLVRGQGVTEGFHSWEIRIPEHKTVGIFARPAQRENLAKLSRDAIAYTGIMQNRVLKPAVFAYVLGAPTKLDFDDPYGNSAWTRAAHRFELLWSEDYFPWLLSVPESFEAEAELKSWVEILLKHALTVLREVEAGMANHSSRHYRIRTEATNRFWGGLYRNFPFMRREQDANSTQA
ncbi:MAG: type I-E CRISPR-associated protein Cse1/CasA [Firmicutes bacterium]|nr:type I-E CRISPR-associated protein Cse1/CasA [Bacillota bacterium]